MLDLDAEEFRRLAHRAVDIVADDLASTQGNPAKPARRPTVKGARDGRAPA